MFRIPIFFENKYSYYKIPKTSLEPVFLRSKVLFTFTSEINSQIQADEEKVKVLSYYKGDRCMDIWGVSALGQTEVVLFFRVS